MMPVAARSKYTAWAFVLTLLFAQLSVLAHALDHQLQKPDKVCALCLHANHLDKAAPPGPVVVACVLPDGHSRMDKTYASHQRHVSTYNVRAPPALPVII